MKIETKFFEPKRKQENTKALGTIKIDDAFIIYITIMYSKDGKYFISYPHYQKQDGGYKDTAYCLDADINTAIINKYLEWDKNINNHPSQDDIEKSIDII